MSKEVRRRMMISIPVFLCLSVLCFLLLLQRKEQHYRMFNNPDVNLTEDGVLQTQYLSLPKGQIRIVMCYTLEHPIKLEIEKGFETFEEYELETGEGLFFETYVDIPESTDLFCIRIQDEENSGFQLFNYELFSAGLFNRDADFLSIFVFMCGLMLIVLFILGIPQKMSRETVITVMVLVGLIIVTSYPLFRNYIVYGHDLTWHLMRIEGMKDAIRGGHLLSIIYPENNNGYGTLGFSYPQLFLYPAALLRLCNVSMATAWNFTLLLINIASAILSYFAMRSICIAIHGQAEGETSESRINTAHLSNLGGVLRRYLPLISTVIFMLSPYRLTNMYIRAAFGELMAMVFVPLFIAGIFHIFCGDHRKWYLFAIASCGILHSHILSTLHYTVLAILFAILLLPNLIKNHPTARIKSGLLACAGIVVVNLWYLIPFMIFYRSGLSVNSISNPLFHMYGIYPGQFFMTQASDYVPIFKSEGMMGEMSQSIGIIGGLCLLLLLYAAFRFWMNYEKNESNQTVGGVGIFSTACCLLAFFVLFLSSTLFPWEQLTNNQGIVSLMGQYPFRFLSLLTGIISVGAPLVLAYDQELLKRTKTIMIVTLLLGLIGCIPILDGAMNKEIRISDLWGGANVEQLQEYWPQGTDEGIFSETDIICENDAEISDLYRNDKEMWFEIKTNDATVITMPLLSYPGYCAKLDGQNLEIGKDPQNRVTITVPEGASGTVKVYHSFWKIFFR